MFTIKVDSEKRKQVYDIIQEIEDSGFMYNDFIFDKYRLEIQIQENQYIIFDIKHKLKDCIMKARVTQIIISEVDGKEIKVECKGTLTMDNHGNLKLGNLNDSMKRLIKARKKCSNQPEHNGFEDVYDEMTMVFANEIDTIQKYIMYKLENREIIYKESTNEHKPRLTKKAIKAAESNEGKDITLDLERTIRYINKKGLHKIHCECWPVRGHYRHYKSGKVIFIPSYKKGKKRNEKAADRTYIV